MTDNLLQFETSPYLLQHRDNPVNWRAWNEAAFDEARRLDRPILLSIGYAACHWCHVMAHESFEDHETAALMNRLFVNIKVDREERPDVDQIYMAALHALGEQGGWPLTMFLTPNAEPIWGGTYFPKTARYGRPGFMQLLTEIARLYREDRAAILTQAGKITAHLAAPRHAGAALLLNDDLLDRASDSILSIMDPRWGGTKGAPKFPNAPVLAFLLQRSGHSDRDDLRGIVETTLEGLALGGIYDHVGGGSARYSVDERWLVPHFEKMLSDNGLLLECFANASLASPHATLFRDRIETIIAWLTRDMLLPGGAFSASEDADSEGVEGRFYVWTPADLAKCLADDDARFIATLYDITPGGNWESVSIPNRLATPQPLSDADDARRRSVLEAMRAWRAQRPRPGRDDKILADWNSLAIAGLARAGQLLERADWIGMAERAFRFTTESMVRDGRQAHALRDGKMVHPGFASDLAALARAAVALHQAKQQRRYVDDAIRFLDELDAHHRAEDGGLYFTADDGERLIIRKSDRVDDATPNPHGMAAETWVRLWALTGDERYRDRADAIIESSAAAIAANVFGTASLLAAFDLRLSVRSLVLIVPEGVDPGALRDVIRRHTRTDLVIDIRGAEDGLPSDHPAHGKQPVDGRATAFLCREGRCSLPVTTAEGLDELLSA